MTKEQKFYKALQDVFIGAKVEGEGGFINLMKIKSGYYSQIEKLLKQDIDKAIEKHPAFREELFDKLHSFFSRYFTESGSIYFNSTPFHNNVYEKVYTDEKDVILFWKTQMLYYVKTDQLFRSMPIEFDGLKFYFDADLIENKKKDKKDSLKLYFDASQVENKKANEKRSLTFELKQIRADDTIVFAVKHSERGIKTKTNEILKELKKNNIKVSEELLKNAFRVFEKQSEVDFFINKNAGAFLQEQFKLWSYQYFWDGAKEWGADRVNQLQILKSIAFKTIDFISQFEDELVKIWNKPKFVKNSNYVITLDRIGDKKLVEKIKKHKKFSEQVKEWRALGINEDNPKVPIDTKYFKDLEMEILGLFDDLDKSLDGWLIKSENYQALNTILPKFKGQVQTIYIDPPYNTGSDGFMYSDRFMHSSWLSMIHNRIDLSTNFLKIGGLFFSSIANNAKYYYESSKLNLLLDNIFPQRMGELVWKRRSGSGSNTIQGITEMHEYILCFGNEKADLNKNILTQEDLEKYKHEDEKGVYKWNNTVINQYTKKQRPNLYYPIFYNEAEEKISFSNTQLNNKGVFTIYPSANGNSVFFCDIESMKEIHKRGILKVFKEKNGEYKLMIKKYLYNTDGTINGNIIKSVLEKNNTQFNIGGTSQGTRELRDLFNKDTFKNPKPSNLLSLLIHISTKIKDSNNYVLDFFAGSGTAAHSVMKLNRDDGGNRKFILIEMAEYFETVIIPRIKKLSYSFSWKDGRPEDTDGIGVFFKYYELEQYEDALTNCKYGDSDLFNKKSENPYQDYVFMKDEKMLSALEIDYKKNKVKVDLSKLYPDIDIAETLSNLTGKWIKAIKGNEVEFSDGSKIDTSDLDYKLIKPLIWW
jgi:adenine specific DNA methylase Mod